LPNRAGQAIPKDDKLRTTRHDAMRKNSRSGSTMFESSLKLDERDFFFMWVNPASYFCASPY